MNENMIFRVVKRAIEMISTNVQPVTESLKEKIESAALKIMTPPVITRNNPVVVQTSPYCTDVQPTIWDVARANRDVARANRMKRPNNDTEVINLQMMLRKHLTQSEDEDNLYNFVFFNAEITNISEQLLNLICHENNPGLVPNDNNDNTEEQRIREQKIEILALNTLMQTLYDKFIELNSNDNIDHTMIENLDCNGLKYIFIEMIHPRRVGDHLKINQQLVQNGETELSEEDFGDINNFDLANSVLNYYEAVNVSSAEISRKLSILNAFLVTASEVATDVGVANATVIEGKRVAYEELRKKYKRVKMAYDRLTKRKEGLTPSNREKYEKKIKDSNNKHIAGGKTMKKQVRKSSRKQVRKSSRKQMKKQVRKSKKSLKKKARK